MIKALRLTIPLLLITLASCVHHRELLNLNEGPEFPNLPESTLYTALRIQPDDLLSISIQSSDPVASAPYSLGSSPGITGNNAAANAAPTASNGFLVDPDGNINLPEIGMITVAGLSTFSARDTITSRLKKFLRAPIVNVRLQNFKYTVLGEVASPGAYSIPNERINVLEALGTAGDVGVYGNRSNVLVIREENGKRSFGRLDLHQRDIFNSPYFYLKQNDLIYVEPAKNKTATVSDSANKYLQWAAPILSIITIIITLSQ